MDTVVSDQMVPDVILLNAVLYANSKVSCRLMVRFPSEMTSFKPYDPGARIRRLVLLYYALLQVAGSIERGAGPNIRELGWAPYNKR